MEKVNTLSQKMADRAVLNMWVKGVLGGIGAILVFFIVQIRDCRMKHMHRIDYSEKVMFALDSFSNGSIPYCLSSAIEEGNKSKQQGIASFMNNWGKVKSVERYESIAEAPTRCPISSDFYVAVNNKNDSIWLGLNVDGNIICLDTVPL